MFNSSLINVRLMDLCFQCSCYVRVRSLPCIPLKFIFIVSGTLRTNLDPFGLHDDVKLWDALKRSHLISNTKRESYLNQGDDSNDEQISTDRFTLDSAIEDEGANLSIGQVFLSCCILGEDLPASAFACIPRKGISQRLKDHYP